MKVPTGIGVGTCSHSGLVRGSNEDDYLLATPPSHGPGLLAAVADGMGGAAGGAEASRMALRAMGATVLDAEGDSDATLRMRQGFREANNRVFESASAVPALSDMGTTLTALWIDGASAVFGHIGDSRLYRLRGDVLEPLTTDHAVSEGESLLTKCIGGGQTECDPDAEVVDVSVGDRFVLCSDGVWNVVPPSEFNDLVMVGDAQVTAEVLVKRALDHGGPDNATAVVVDVLSAAAGGTADVDLPRHERPDARSLWPAARSLHAGIWSWMLLVGAVLVLVYAAFDWFGLDPLGWIPS